MRCLINRLFSPASLRLTHHRTTKKWISFRQTVIHFFQWRHIATHSLLLWLDLDWIGPAAAGRFPEEILINRNNELLFFLLLRWEEDVNLASDFWLCFWAEWKWKANKRLPKVSRLDTAAGYFTRVRKMFLSPSLSTFIYLFTDVRTTLRYATNPGVGLDRDSYPSSRIGSSSRLHHLTQLLFMTTSTAGDVFAEEEGLVDSVLMVCLFFRLFALKSRPCDSASHSSVTMSVFCRLPCPGLAV